MRRGARVESVHAVAAAAVDPRGTLALALGSIDLPIWLRSTAKPLIAAEIVRSGAADGYGFDERELAVICASHGGEPGHVAAVQSVLRKIGLDEAALQCGVQPPAHASSADALAARGEAPSALHNNCSGKHAGILALALHLGSDPAGYLAPEHPAQRAILATCARLCGLPTEEIPLAVDGCGIPVIAVALRSAALAFARLATLEGIAGGDARALERVRTAVAHEPWYLAGTGRFDSALAGASGGRIVGKGGAEGVHGDALIREGLGLALKVVDGARRAVPPATLALLRRLGALDSGERDALAPFERVLVRNVAGRVVGVLEALVPETEARPPA
ncbi:MAG: asparaginase [Vulcanimicrobiaceae bacterium]